MNGATQTKTLAWRLVVETQGIERNTRAAANSLTKLQEAASRAGTLLRAAVAGGIVKQYINLADTYRTISNRLRLVTDDAQELATVQKELVALAQETRLGLGDTVDLYARAARSLRDYGLSQQEILDFTETVSKAIQVSGATAKEAAQGVIQFSQGLASGKLAGDELRAVLEQMPRLGRAIAEGMGVAYGDIRKLAAEGKITTAEILRAIESQGETIQREFETLAPTVEGAWNVMKNAALVAIGEFDSWAGVTDGLAQSMIDLGKALTDLAPKIGLFAISLREQIIGQTLDIMNMFHRLPIEFAIAMTKMKKLMTFSERRDAQLDQQIARLEGLNVRSADELAAQRKLLEDDISELMERQRAAAANLNKPGTPSGNLGGATAGDAVAAAAKDYGLISERFLRAEETGRTFADVMADLNAEFETQVVQANALAIAQTDGAAAAQEYLIRQEASKNAQAQINSLLREGKQVTEEMSTAIYAQTLATERLAAANEETAASVGELSEAMALKQGAVKIVVDNFIDFLADGEFNVKKFVQSTLKELAKFAIQAAVFKAVFGNIYGPVRGADGMVMAGGALVPFATGGIVTGPTTFPITGGRTGLMGEAGPEAIMPLARLSGGKLGVSAQPQNIEIINKTGVNAAARIQATADRTSIILEAAELGANMAEDRVTRSMRTGYGATSSAMQRTYGLRRRG